MCLIASEYIGQQNNVLISEMRLITRKYGVLPVGPYDTAWQAAVVTMMASLSLQQLAMLSNVAKVS